AVSRERALGVPQLAGDRRADQDADRKRDENSREGDEVIAKVEHLRESPGWERYRRLDVRKARKARTQGVLVLAHEGATEDGPRRHSANDDEAASARAAKKTGCAAADDGPASVLHQAAPIRLDTRVRRPPVGKAVRLDHERPHVLPRREQDP